MKRKNYLIQSTVRNLISETQDIANFFEMHKLHIIWLFAFKFITCKFSVDACSLLNSKLLHSKLCLFLIMSIVQFNYQIYQQNKNFTY